MTRRLWPLALLGVLTLAGPKLFTALGGPPGADGAAAVQARALDPNYEPWFAFLWEPGPLEPWLFTLQVALGIALFGGALYVAKRSPTDRDRGSR